MHTGGGGRLLNLPFSHISDLHDLDLGLGHMAYHHISLTDLYLYTKFRLIWKTKLFVDGWVDAH